MSAPHAILVVPAAGDPGGLLAPGRCGASAPSVSQYTCALGHVSMWRLERWTRPHCPAESDKPPPRICFRYGARVDALPLWWDGALVAEGWDRARRGTWACAGWAWDDETIDLLGRMEPGAVRAVTLAGWLVEFGVASRVVLLDLVGGRLVEPAP